MLIVFLDSKSINSVYYEMHNLIEDSLIRIHLYLWYVEQHVTLVKKKLIWHSIVQIVLIVYLFAFYYLALTSAAFGSKDKYTSHHLQYFYKYRPVFWILTDISTNQLRRGW